VLRLGVLPERYIYPKAERAVRDVLRKRTHLVRQQTATVFSLQNLIVRNTGVRLSAKRIHCCNGWVLPRVLRCSRGIRGLRSSRGLLVRSARFRNSLSLVPELIPMSLVALRRKRCCNRRRRCPSCSGHRG
jgi:hypothetical protein